MKAALIKQGAVEGVELFHAELEGSRHVNRVLRRYLGFPDKASRLLSGAPGDAVNVNVAPLEEGLHFGQFGDWHTRLATHGENLRERKSRGHDHHAASIAFIENLATQIHLVDFVLKPT